MKTKQISNYLDETLCSDMMGRYDGVEWFCPDGPLKLVPDARYDSTDPEDVATYAWYWTPQNFEQRHDHLLPALEYLAKYITEQGPFDGLVGFSQGAAIGTMLASWCENTPSRKAALSGQPVPLTLPSPQSPFKFAISSCGFQGSLKYYPGFYSPQISTPSLHLSAEYDTMVSAAQTTALAASFTSPTTLPFVGTHHVPTDRASLYEIASFITTTLTQAHAPPPCTPYALPGDFFSKVAAMKVARFAVEGPGTPYSEVEGDVFTPGCYSNFSESSSSSGAGGRRKPKGRLLVIKRTSQIRRVASFSSRKG